LRLEQPDLSKPGASRQRNLDTWHILSDSQRPEHQIYEKLAAAKVQHIATVLDHSDIQDHRTHTGDYANETWVCKVKLKPIRTLRHFYRRLATVLLCSAIFVRYWLLCVTLSKVRTLNLTTILPLRDLAAHRESYYEGRVLHRDISALTYDGGGLLVDWEILI
jgi:hypothetical protein